MILIVLFLSRLRSDLKDLVQDINNKMPNEDEAQNCDVDLVTSFNDLLSSMKTSLGVTTE